MHVWHLRESQEMPKSSSMAGADALGPGAGAEPNEGPKSSKPEGAVQATTYTGHQTITRHILSKSNKDSMGPSSLAD